MDLVNEYFEFRKKYVVEYCKLIMGDTSDNKLRDTYFNEYISTYLNTYYLETFATINDKDRLSVDYFDIINEIKGKAYELIYELDKKRLSKEKTMLAKDLITKTCTYSSISIILDMKDYSTCEVMEDFEITLKRVFEKNNNIVKLDKETFDKLVRLVRRNKKMTEDFIKEINSSNFFLELVNYRSQNDKYAVKLHFNIKQLSTSKKFVVDKVFESRDVYVEKTKQKINLLNELILNNLFKKEKCSYYFLNIPLEYIESKEDLKMFMDMVSNPIIKKYVVFVLNYKYYSNKKLLFRDFADYNFALLIDLSRSRDINSKLEELETLSLFKYIIIDKVKDEDRRLVTSYEIKGKEIFQNSYDYDSEDE